MAILIYPDSEWSIERLELPVIYYRRSNKFPHPTNVIPGASWTFCINTPHWELRRAIFEDNYFPYKFEFYYLPIRNGFIAIDRLNLCYLTDIDEPNVVYMKLNDKFVQRMEFKTASIDLTEFINIEQQI